jgi:hypothetical protein
MAASLAQKTAFVTAFRAWSEQLKRTLDQGAALRDMFNDLGITLTDADLNAMADSAGLSAADINAALTIASQIVGEFTAARRGAVNKIGHGAP